MTTRTKPEIRRNANTKGEQIMSAVNTLKLKLLKAKVMNAYSESVRSGNLHEAHGLLTLLNRGNVCLGLGDIAYKVECLLEGLGCQIRYSRNYGIATAYLAPEL